jgi:hypothetical protein
VRQASGSVSTASLDVAVKVHQPELYPTIDILVAGEPLPHGLPLQRSPLHAEDPRSLVEADGAIGLVSSPVDVLFEIRGHRDAGTEIGVQSADRSSILDRSAAREAFYKRRVDDHLRQRRDGPGNGAWDVAFTGVFTDTATGSARSTGYPRPQRPSVSAIHPPLRVVLQLFTSGRVGIHLADARAQSMPTDP